MVCKMLRVAQNLAAVKGFQDLFESSFLPHAKRLAGKKVLIGDNLVSYFNPHVLKLCEENDVFGVIDTTPRARRKKSRLNIEPGKSVIADTSSSSNKEHDLSEEHAENSTGSEEEDNDDII
ncbi:hypothetical protein ILUMI_17767 [Ignelater luminosus]|uniref:Uncharacterized protein n=1 Tax=Ignelater luminosus TaxID=2038154 RepID=A0A8K0G778_IGNLU|nr:hypothetical protein ILUMI_17767 [Ignelater luminosus]